MSGLGMRVALAALLAVFAVCCAAPVAYAAESSVSTLTSVSSASVSADLSKASSVSTVVTASSVSTQDTCTSDQCIADTIHQVAQSWHIPTVQLPSGATGATVLRAVRQLLPTSLQSLVSVRVAVTNSVSNLIDYPYWITDASGVDYIFDLSKNYAVLQNLPDDDYFDSHISIAGAQASTVLTIDLVVGGAAGSEVFENTNELAGGDTNSGSASQNSVSDPSTNDFESHNDLFVEEDELTDTQMPSDDAGQTLDTETQEETSQSGAEQFGSNQSGSDQAGSDQTESQSGDSNPLSLASGPSTLITPQVYSPLRSAILGNQSIAGIVPQFSVNTFGMNALQGSIIAPSHAADDHNGQSSYKDQSTSDSQTPRQKALPQSPSSSRGGSTAPRTGKNIHVEMDSAPLQQDDAMTSGNIAVLATVAISVIAGIAGGVHSVRKRM